MESLVPYAWGCPADQQHRIAGEVPPAESHSNERSLQISRHATVQVDDQGRLTNKGGQRHRPPLLEREQARACDNTEAAAAGLAVVSPRLGTCDMHGQCWEHGWYTPIQLQPAGFGGN